MYGIKLYCSFSSCSTENLFESCPTWTIQEVMHPWESWEEEKVFEVRMVDRCVILQSTYSTFPSYCLCNWSFCVARRICIHLSIFLGVRVTSNSFLSAFCEPISFHSMCSSSFMSFCISDSSFMPGSPWPVKDLRSSLHLLHLCQHQTPECLVLLPATRLWSFIKVAKITNSLLLKLLLQ